MKCEITRGTNHVVYMSTVKYFSLALHKYSQYCYSDKGVFLEGKGHSWIGGSD